MLRPRRIVVALVVAPWLLWAVARTFALDDVHPLVAILTFTPYAAATAIVPVIVALVAREWVLAGIAALALVALGVAVVPRALDGPQLAGPDTRGRPFVVMTVNMFRGKADARDVVRLAREHDVDLLSVQEAGPESVEQLDLAGGFMRLPRQVFTGDNVGLLARRRLRDVKIPAKKEPQQLRAVLDLSGGDELAVVVVHPYPPLSRHRVRFWRDVFRALPDPFEGGRPHLLLGDFNATLDHGEVRRLLDRGYADAADATGDGLFPSFPIGRNALPITIDHVLIPKTFHVRKVSYSRVLGSDHRAMIAELLLPETERAFSSGREPAQRSR